MRTGRPSEYDETVLAKTLDYLARHAILGDPVPTIEGLCDEIGCSKPTVYAWGEADPDFLYALERLKAKQGRLLQSSGLKGDFAPVITKLMLSANHGMAEKSEQKQEHSGKIEGLVVQFVNGKTES